MAESNEIKFTEEELKSLQEVQTGYQEMQVKMGGLKMQQIAHDRNAERLDELEETLMTELQELNDNEQKVAGELKKFDDLIKKKYGEDHKGSSLT